MECRARIFTFPDFAIYTLRDNICNTSTLWSPPVALVSTLSYIGLSNQRKTKSIIESINFWTKKTMSSMEQGFLFLLLDFTKLLCGIVVFHCCLMTRWQPSLSRFLMVHKFGAYMDHFTFCFVFSSPFL